MRFDSEEELERSGKIADDRKKFVLEIGREKLEIGTALNHYRSKVPNWEELDEDDPIRVKIEKWEARLEEIESLDGMLGASVEFTTMIEVIKQINQHRPAIKMMEHLEKEGVEGIRVPSDDEIKKVRQDSGGKWPDGTLICPLNGKVYFQDIESSGRGRARLLNKVVRAMIKSGMASRIEEMATSGSHNLKGLRRGRIIPGKYYLFTEAQKIEKDGNTFMRPETHILVEVYDKNKGEAGARPYLMMRVLDTFMGTTKVKKMRELKKPFPAFWFEKGQVLAREDDRRRLNEEEKELVGDTIRVLNGILSAWERNQKVEAPASIPKVPDPIAGPAPEEVPVNHTITADNGTETKVFVKPKKGTKTKNPEPLESAV